MALDSTQATTSALAGLDAPTPAAPAYVGPAAQPAPTFFGRLLQGALNGLAGGIQSGAENSAGVGTPGFTPRANGLAYAQQLQARQDQAKQQQQTDATQAAQQDFENRTKQYQAEQEATVQKAQAVQAKLGSIHLAQQIQGADQDRQDAYFKDQQRQIDTAQDNGAQVIATIPHVPLDGKTPQERGAAYIQQHPELMSDPHSQIKFTADGDGEVSIHVLKYDPNARATAEEVNQQLASVGSSRKVPAGSTMSAADAHALVSQEAGTVANSHLEQTKELYKSNLDLRNRLAETNAQAAKEVTIEKMKEAAAALPSSGSDPSQPLDKTLETLVNSVHNGDATPSQVTKGMGSKAVAGNRAMQARYELKYMTPTLPDGSKNPDYDPQAQSWQAAEGNFKEAYSNANDQNIRSAADLYGTKDPKTGKVLTQGAIGDLEAKMQHIQAKYPAAFGTGPGARAALATLHYSGDSTVEDLMASAPEIAQRAAKFASSGNPSSDATYKANVAAVERARTPAALFTAFAGLKDTAGEVIASMKNTNPALAARMKNINDPGTHNDPNNVAIDSKTPFGANSIPTAGPNEVVKRRPKPGGGYEYKVVPKP